MTWSLLLSQHNEVQQINWLTQVHTLIHLWDPIVTARLWGRRPRLRWSREASDRTMCTWSRPSASAERMLRRKYEHGVSMCRAQQMLLTLQVGRLPKTLGNYERSGFTMLPGLPGPRRRPEPVEVRPCDGVWSARDGSHVPE